MLEILLIALALLGCLYWLGLLALTLQARSKIPALAEQRPAEPERWPRLSVIIPARDEADTLEPALRSQIAQDYPALELIAVDDRSSDDTGALIDRIAAEDQRVRAVHVETLPEGWLGKLNAMQVGVEAASGDWLLFMDADVQLTPDALRRAVAYAEAEQLDYLTALPRLLEADALTDAGVSFTARSVFIGGQMWQAMDPGSDRSAGFGAFMMVRREALSRTPGLEWMRMEVADDIALGLLMKRAGARCAVVNAREQLRLNFYPDLGTLRSSMEKGAFAIIGRYSLARVVLAATAIPLVEVAPLAALIPTGVPWRPLLGVCWLLLGLITCVTADRWSGRTGRGGLLFPVGALLVSWFTLRSGVIGVRRGGIRWRDTFYPIAKLRAGMRVLWP